MKIAAIHVMVDMTVATMSGYEVEEPDSETDSKRQQRQMTGGSKEDERKEQETDVTNEQRDMRQQLHRLHELVTAASHISVFQVHFGRAFVASVWLCL